MSDWSSLVIRQGTSDVVDLETPVGTVPCAGGVFSAGFPPPLARTFFRSGIIECAPDLIDIRGVFILIQLAAPRMISPGRFFTFPSYGVPGSSTGFRARQELPGPLLQSCRARPRPAVRLSPRSHRRRHRRALFGCAGQNLPGIRRNPPAGPGAEQGAMHEPSRNSETPPWKLTMA